MHCIRCGFNNEDNAGACRRCGAALWPGGETILRPAPAHADNRTLYTADGTRVIAFGQGLSGTVIDVDPIWKEKPDWSWWRLAGYVFIGLGVLCALPLIILLSLLKIVKWRGIFKGIFLFSITRRERLDDTQYFRLRQGLDREFMVRRKGKLQGHVTTGDEVCLQGKFRNGVFNMTSGTITKLGVPFR